MIEHNPLDIDENNNIVDTPFYKFIARYQPTTLVHSLQLYFNCSYQDLYGQFGEHTDTYKIILDAYWRHQLLEGKG